MDTANSTDQKSITGSPKQRHVMATHVLILDRPIQCTNSVAHDYFLYALLPCSGKVGGCCYCICGWNWPEEVGRYVDAYGIFIDFDSSSDYTSCNLDHVCLVFVLISLLASVTGSQCSSTSRTCQSGTCQLLTFAFNNIVVGCRLDNKATAGWHPTFQNVFLIV